MVLRHQIKGVTALALFASLLAPDRTLTGNERTCNIHQGACTIIAGRRTVTLNIEPKPVRAMHELTFSVTVAPCDSLPERLLLDLSMPGMQMGKNQVALAKKNTGTYEGRGIIVRCMSGRTLWRAAILSAELNNPAFIFNVRE